MEVLNKVIVNRLLRMLINNNIKNVWKFVQKLIIMIKL
jgi:hypothetical protein